MLFRALQISALVISVPVILVAAYIEPTAAASPATAATNSSKQNSSDMPMNTSPVAPLVIESADWTSVLTLVNESQAGAHAMISLQAAGDDMSAPVTQTVELPGHSSTRLSIQTLLAGRGMDFWGSLTVGVQEPTIAKNMAVAAQLTLIGRGNLTGQSADEELIMPMMGGSLKAVAQSRKTLIAIQNSGMQLAHATIGCLEHGKVHQSALLIPAGEMRFLQSCDPFTGDFRSASPDLSAIATPVENGAETGTLDREHGLAYQVSSASSELAAFGLSLSFDQQRFHAAPVIFTHQSEFTSRSTVFAGIPIGPYDPLPGVVLAPELALANFTEATHHVTVSDVLSGAPVPPKALTSVSLEPYEVKRLKLPFNTSGDPGIASLIIEQDGAPGEVVSSLIDRDSSGETALVPLPKFLHHANNGGGHPWSLELGTSSTFLIFNADMKPQLVNLSLGTDGTVWHDTITLNPYESRTMSLAELITNANESNAEKRPDREITARHGEISWFTPSQADVFGRVLIARQQNGGRALESYSCGYNIVMCGSYLAGPATATFAVGSTGTIGPIAAQTCTAYSPTACSGQSYGTGGGYSYFWASNNTSIATVSGSNTNPSGTFLGKSAGTAIGQGTIANGTGCAFVADGTLTVYNPAPTSVLVTGTISSAANSCKAGQAGWKRVVTLQLLDQQGAYYQHSGTVADTISIGSRNDLIIIGTQTGSTTSSATGSWPDTYSVCSPACPASTGETDANQSWTYNGVGLPHVNALGTC